MINNNDNKDFNSLKNNNQKDLQSNTNNSKMVHKKHLMELRKRNNPFNIVDVSKNISENPNNDILKNLMDEIDKNSKEIDMRNNIIKETELNIFQKELEVKEVELDIREIELNKKEIELYKKEFELEEKENKICPILFNKNTNYDSGVLSNLFREINQNKMTEKIDTEVEDSEDDENKKNNKKGKKNEKNNNKENDNNKNGKNNDKKRNYNDLNEEDDPFTDFVFTVINMKNPNIPPENNNNEPPSKKQKIDENDFHSYFQEASELTPIIKEIKTLEDLIHLGKTYDPKDPKRYVIQMKALNKCVPVLEELNAMIGMKNVKSMIMDLLFFRLQNIEDKEEVQEKKRPKINIQLPPFLRPPPMCSDNECEEEEDKINIQNMESLNKDTNSLKEMYHMVITGSPGSGKTEVAKILAKLYYCLGITKKDKFTLAKRSDLIGKYLGHTAKMTQDVFNKAKGGILFIDEAYSLGNPEGRDSFSKECIDTINQNLTENKDTVVFIAGYKEQLEESFFAYNPGLHRRFKFRLEVDKYNAEELRLIFLKKIKDSKWNILNNNPDTEIPLSLFEKHREIFKFNGGDMENLWHLTKIVHARRIFGKSRDFVKKINVDDIKKAIELYMENDEVKKRNDDIKKYIQDTLYV